MARRKRSNGASEPSEAVRLRTTSSSPNQESDSSSIVVDKEAIEKIVELRRACETRREAIKSILERISSITNTAKASDTLVSASSQVRELSYQEDRAKGLINSLTESLRRMKITANSILCPTKREEQINALDQWTQECTQWRLEETVKDQIHECTALVKFATQTLEQRSLEQQMDRMSVQESQRRPSPPLDVYAEGNEIITDRRRLPPLPALQLPRFDGEPSEYESFKVLFTDMVDKRTDLSDAEKFLYLKSCVVGSAVNLIKHIPVIHGNYQLALTIIDDTFGRNQTPSLLYEEMIRQCLPNQSLTSQLEFNRTLSYHVRKITGMENGNSNYILGKMIMDKFPYETKKHLVEYKLDYPHATPIDIIQECERYLQRQIQRNAQLFYQVQDGKPAMKVPPTRKEYVHRTDMDEHEDQVVAITSHKSQNGLNLSRAASFPVEKMDRSTPQMRCAFCSKHQQSETCRTVSMVKARWTMVIKRKLCRKCLQHGHLQSACTAPACESCGKDHHIALCYSRVDKRKSSNTSQQVQQSSSQDYHTVAACGQHKGPSLLTGYAHVANPTQAAVVHYLIDTGASVSIVSNGLAKRMNLRPESFVTCSIHGITGNTGIKELPRYQVPLRSSNGQVIMLSALGMEPPFIGSAAPKTISPEDATFLRKHNLESPTIRGSQSELEILIGGNQLYDILSLDEPAVKLPSGLMLLQTKLGNIIAGNGKEGPSHSHTILRIDVLPALIDSRKFESDMENFLSVDKCGKERYGTEKEAKDLENQEAKEFFLANVSKVDNRYHVKYFLRPSAGTVADNYKSSYVRLKKVLKDLKTNGRLEEYIEVLNNHIKEGHVERVTPGTLDGPLATYLPHHPVIRPDKKEKPLRIVFDASCRSDGKPSLNDVMAVGNIALEEIPALMIRNRLWRHVITADIRSAFMQLKIKKEQRDIFRFLWIENPQGEVTPQNLIVYRFTTAPFGVKQSPFLLQAVIQHHLQDQIQRTTDTSIAAILQRIKNNIYVDNMIIGTDSKDDAVLVVRTVQKVFQEAGMHVREFSSTLPLVKKILPPDDMGKTGPQKLLGLHWNNQRDTICLPIELSSEARTKRSLLSTLASCFDPLGLLTPALLPAKMFIQKLWKKDLKWDSDIGNELQMEWNRIISQGNSMHTIPRHIVSDKEASCKLIAFSDASSKACAACVYFVQGNRSHLVFAKSSLAPVKVTPTIPKLELQGIVLAARALLYCLNTISPIISPELMDTAIFSDSRTAIQWAIDPARTLLSPYISHRVNELQEINHVTKRKTGKDILYGHVEGLSNPADVASRGCSGSQLAENVLWWRGPDWITDNLSERIFTPTEKEKSDYLHVVAALELCEPPTIPISPINLKRFSSLRKCVRVTALVIRFLRRITKGRRHEKWKSILGPEIEGSTGLSQGEMDWSCKILIKMNQSAHPDVIQNAGSLRLFKDNDGIYRCKGGRLGNTTLPYEQQYPALICKSKEDTTLATLIIQQTHKEIAHGSRAHTLSALRNHFWIIQGTRMVRKVLENCIVCRKAYGRALKYPDPPDLPLSRVQPSPPFTHIGLDYGGPFTVKQSDGTRQKSYCLLFTCLSTRAIHLETTVSISIQATMNAIRRMMARRGVPRSLLSDQAPSFIMAHKFLSRPVEEWAIQFNTLFGKEPISWKFTSPHAPWQGGVYERLMGSVKHAMKSTIGRKILDVDEWTTVVTEIEAVLNTRPLTTVTDDSMLVLRPIDMLRPKIALAVPFVQHDDDDDSPNYTPASDEPSTHKQFQRSLSSMERILDKFWNLWKTRYLQELKDSNIVSQVPPKGTSASSTPMEGDLLLIIDENRPRGEWKMGRVTSVTARRVTMKTENGLIERPHNLVVPLELHAHSSTRH